jgi:hypothetical protein
MSVTIKSGSYCPICRGITLCDCKHPAHLFQASYFNEYIKAKEEVTTLTARLEEAHIANKALHFALAKTRGES